MEIGITDLILHPYQVLAHSPPRRISLRLALFCRLFRQFLGFCIRFQLDRLLGLNLRPLSIRCNGRLNLIIVLLE